MISSSLSLKAKDKAKQNPSILLVVLVMAHLIVISLNRVPGQPDVRYLHSIALTVAYPFQWVAAHGVASVKGGINRYFLLRDKTQENEYLRARNAELEALVVEYGEKAKFLDQLNSINRSPALSQFPKVVARVIGRDSIPWFNTVVIDRGALSGITRNQPVVTAEGGLVGRIIQVSPVSARVLLITDERHGAGALIAQTIGSRALGVLKGRNESVCDLKFSEPPEKITNGEQVITSGQDRLYPKGLLIGWVVNLAGSGSVPQSVEVKPAAGLARLETVAVLALSPEEIDQQYEALVKEEEQEREKNEKTSDRKKR